MKDIPAAFHFEHSRRVEFSDTDLAGIVHFANFLRYVESAEHAFWRSVGKSVHHGEGEEQNGWPRLNINCNYFKPARFEQVLKICLLFKEVRNTTLCYGFWIFDDSEPEPALVSAGEVTIIHVGLESNSGRLTKQPIPEDLRTLFRNIME